MSQEKLISLGAKIQYDQIKVDFITKLDRVGLPIDWKFNNDSIHSSTLKEVSLNSQFLSSAYELKVNQRKGIRK